MTSISKLSNSTYWSVAFQVNEGCFGSSPPCICLCTFFRQAVLVPDLVPASTFFSAITAAVAACTATRLTVSLIPSDYAFQLDLNFSVLLVFVCLE